MFHTEGTKPTGTVETAVVVSVQLCREAQLAANLPSRSLGLSTAVQEVWAMGSCLHLPTVCKTGQTVVVEGLGLGKRGSSCFIGGGQRTDIMKHDLMGTKLGWQY